MANAKTVTYATIQSRLLDFLTVANDGNVANVALDLLNRAQQYLWQLSDWRGIVKTSPLAVSSSLEAVAPADFGRLLSMWWDANGDGVPDGFFDEMGGHDPARAVSVISSFDKATGYSTKFRFSVSPQSAPNLTYVALLEDFAGTGTEYSFFPAELLLKCAEMLHLEEHGSRQNELNECRNQFVQSFVAARQLDTRGEAQDRAVRDSLGGIIHTESVSLVE
jgi:hypothetical protein